MGAVVELGAEGEGADRLVLDIAEDHAIAQGDVRLVADADQAEAVGQRGQVAHAQFHETGVAADGIVVAEGRLRRRADTVALCIAACLQDQLAGAADLVVAGGEIDVVGDDLDGLAADAGGQHAGAQREQRFARVQMHVDHAMRRVQAAVDAAIVDHAETVQLAHHDVARGGVGMGAQVDHGEFGHVGVEYPLDADPLQADQRVRRHQDGIADIDQPGRGQGKVGGAPTVGVAALQHRGGGVVGDFDAIQAIVEVDGAAAVDDQLVVVQQQRRGRDDGVHLQAVETAAAGHLQISVAAHQDQVVTLAGVHGIDTVADDDGVIAAAGEDGVPAGAHVDVFGAVAADEAVVAVAAVIADAVAAAADELVVAGAAADHAVGAAADDGEHVVAGAAVEFQFGGDAGADVDDVVALAGVGDDLAHAAGGVAMGDAHGVDHDLVVGRIQVALVVERDRRRFVDGVVVDVAAAVAPGHVAHVQVQHVADHVGDDRRIRPAPEIVAGHGDADDGDAGLQVGRGRGQFDAAAEAGQGLLNLEQTQVDVDVERAVHAGGDALAADGQRHARVQLEDGHVDVDVDRAVDLELAVRLDVATDVDVDEAEEVQRRVDLQAEHVVHQLHAAGELQIEGQHAQVAVEMQVEDRAGADDVVAHQRGVVLVAGVDLQDGMRLDAEDAHAQFDVGLHAQREHQVAVGLGHEGDGAVDVDAAQIAQLQHQLGSGLHAAVVDLQRHGAVHGDRVEQADAGGAGDVQRLRRQIDQHERIDDVGIVMRVERVVLDVVGVDRAHPLRFAGGIQLQQEVAADLEDAAVDQGRFRPHAAHFQRAVDAPGDDAQRAGRGQGLQHGQVEHRADRQLHAGLRHDDAEIPLQQQRIVEQ